jgi:ComF family protein
MLPGWLKKTRDMGVDMALPLRCLDCGGLFHRSGNDRHITPGCIDIDTAFTSLMDVFLCPACRLAFSGIGSPMCSGCGLPFESPHSRDHLCEKCQARPFLFHQARSVGRYEGALRTLVHQFKYQGWIHLAGTLGRLLWIVFLSHWNPEDVDTVVPVPLHARRLRHRGFNQALQLIRPWPQWASEQGLAFEKDRIKSSWLVRRSFTAVQAGLDRHQREADVKNAFVLKKDAQVDGRRILLVDDVLTTGATVQACARVLKQCGAARVDVLTLARTI